MRLQKALDAYHRALALWRDVKESRGEALALTALGNLQNKLGDRQEALNSHLQARQLIEPTGDRPSTAIILANIAVVYRGLGEERRALEYWDQALLLFQATDDPLGRRRDSIGYRPRLLPSWRKPEGARLLPSCAGDFPPTRHAPPGSADAQRYRGGSRCARRQGSRARLLQAVAPADADWPGRLAPRPTH